MKLLGREFNRLILRLKDDHLIKYDVKVEVQESNKQLLKTVYFFNFVETRNVIKYKIFQMAQQIEAQARMHEDTFFCTECDRGFTVLEAQARVEDFIFKCSFCGGELEERLVGGGEGGIDLKGLMGMLQPLVALLKEVDQYNIPSMDYFQVLEMKKAAVAKGAAAPMEKAEKAVAVVEDDGQEFCSEEAAPQKAPAVAAEMVMVAGRPRPLLEITPEDLEEMTEEEYTAYFERYSESQKT